MRGLDAPTPARVVGLPPRRGSTFFRSERKYQRKHAARRLREKGFYCPFCRRGSQRRAQWSWTAIPNACARSCARLFPPSKWAGLFPSAAYRRSAPPPLGWGRRSNSAGWATFAWGGRFCKAIGQKGFQIILAFAASHETFRRVAVCNGQSAGDRTRPASREARCRTAVTPQPSCFPSSGPAPMGAVWGAGDHPLPRAARPVAERRPWGRKRRKREAFRRAFPKRHAYLHSPARLWRAVRGAGIQSLRGVPKKKRATVPGPV